MKKEILIALLSVLVTGTFAQQEFAMNTDLVENMIGKKIKTETATLIAGIDANGPIFVEEGLAEGVNQDPDVPAAPVNDPVEEIIFGEDFSIQADSVTGGSYMKLDREYSELMVFMRNKQGKMVFAQLFQQVDEIDLSAASAEGEYVIEILSNDGNKTVMTLLKE